MGRYYTGQISGKFWFAIQDSYDASYFGVEPEDIWNYHVCLCYLSKSDIDIEKNMYCEDCYTSYLEHLEAMKEDEIDDDHTWALSESEVNYNFDESDKETLLEKISDLEGKVGKYMDSYKIQDNDGDIGYDYSVPKDVTEEELPLIAKLCLGKQIAYCLEKNGTCSFTAEL